MISMELTQEEMELLCAVYPGEELIRQGKLLPTQEQALEMLRAGSEYLRARYPAEEIRILSFVPGDRFNPWAELRFCCGGEETAFTAIVEPEEGGYRCADTLCGARIRPAYDALVEQTLRDAGFRALSRTSFPNPIGGDFPADGTAEELLRLYPTLKRSTRLFLAAEDEREGLTEELHAALREAGLYGNYAVAFVGSLEGQDAERLSALWNELPHRSFTVFDID